MDFKNLNLDGFTKDLQKQLEDVKNLNVNKERFVKLSSWYVDVNDITAYSDNEVKLRNGATLFFDNLSAKQINEIIVKVK